MIGAELLHIMFGNVNGFIRFYIYIIYILYLYSLDFIIFSIALP